MPKLYIDGELQECVAFVIYGINDLHTHSEDGHVLITRVLAPIYYDVTIDDKLAGRYKVHGIVIGEDGMISEHHVCGDITFMK